MGHIAPWRLSCTHGSGTVCLFFLYKEINASISFFSPNPKKGSASNAPLQTCGCKRLRNSSIVSSTLLLFLTSCAAFTSVPPSLHHRAFFINGMKAKSNTMDGTRILLMLACK